MVLLLETPTEGSIQFEGNDIGGFSSSQLHDYRGAVQAVFQGPVELPQPSDAGPFHHRRAADGEQGALLQELGAGG